MHCVHGSTMNQERRLSTTQQQHIIRTSLSISLTDSLHFESDKINDWMLVLVGAKEPK